MSAQALGREGTRVDTQLKRLRDVAADCSMYDGSRPIALREFFKDIPSDFNEGYVS